MRLVDFKFDIDDRVVTMLGDIGVVSSLCLDHHEELMYFVELPGGRGSWFREDQIKKEE